MQENIFNRPGHKPFDFPYKCPSSSTARGRRRHPQSLQMVRFLLLVQTHQPLADLPQSVSYRFIQSLTCRFFFRHHIKILSRHPLHVLRYSKVDDGLCSQLWTLYQQGEKGTCKGSYMRSLFELHKPLTLIFMDKTIFGLILR